MKSNIILLAIGAAALVLIAIGYQAKTINLPELMAASKGQTVDNESHHLIDSDVNQDKKKASTDQHSVPKVTESENRTTQLHSLQSTKKPKNPGLQPALANANPNESTASLSEFNNLEGDEHFEKSLALPSLGTPFSEIEKAIGEKARPDKLAQSIKDASDMDTRAADIEWKLNDVIVQADELGTVELQSLECSHSVCAVIVDSTSPPEWSKIESTLRGHQSLMPYFLTPAFRYEANVSDTIVRIFISFDIRDLS